MKKFDYSEAVGRLEEILARVEDPATSVDDIDKYVREAEKLGAGCKEYLRSVREKADAIGKEE